MRWLHRSSHKVLQGGSGNVGYRTSNLDTTGAGAKVPRGRGNNSCVAAHLVLFRVVDALEQLAGDRLVGSELLTDKLSH